MELMVFPYSNCLGWCVRLKWHCTGYRFLLQIKFALQVLPKMQTVLYVETNYLIQVHRTSNHGDEVEL